MLVLITDCELFVEKYYLWTKRSAISLRHKLASGQVNHTSYALFKTLLDIICVTASICSLKAILPAGYRCLWVGRGLYVCTAASPAATYKPSTTAGKRKRGRERDLQWTA